MNAIYLHECLKLWDLFKSHLSLEANPTLDILPFAITIDGNQKGVRRMKFALKNLRIVTPFRIVENGVIIVEGKKISELGRVGDISIPDNIKVYDLAGKLAVPGFIDLHVHGAVGHDFTEVNPETLAMIADFYIKHGTTGLLATLYTKPRDALIRDIRRLVSYMEWGEADPSILGIHVEGPFINPKMHGALKEDYIWKPVMDDWLSLRDAGHGYIKLMTIAPEVDGAMRIIRDASMHGVVPSIGHSMSDYETIEVAIDNGAAQVTHIFNAMKPMHHRNPGVLTAAFLRDELKVQLIADGYHVHPAVMKLLVKLKGHTGILLISDAIKACGMPDGEYIFSDQKIEVKEGKAFLPGGKLAGSVLTMDRAVRNMVKMVGVPLTHAVRMASLNPAKVLGLSRKGILAVGKDADIVIMDREFDVYMTIQEGRIRYRNEEIQ